MPGDPHKYVIYIDEAGEPGVKQKPAVELQKSSEWFVVSAVVVSAERDQDVVDWVRDMREAVRAQQRTPLHFRKLSRPNQERVSRMLSTKDVRIFTVASHKTNMRGHQNRRLGSSLGRGEFYNWCLRLLLERVTDWCARRSRKAAQKVEPARLIFSERGGHDYDHLTSYIDLLNMQASTGTTFLAVREITPGVISSSTCEILPHHQRAGLQLADIAASSFFQAADSQLPTHSLACATSLKLRTAIAPRKRDQAEYGLLKLPFRHQGEILEADRPLFELFGYVW